MYCQQTCGHIHPHPLTMTSLSNDRLFRRRFFSVLSSEIEHWTLLTPVKWLFLTLKQFLITVSWSNGETLLVVVRVGNSARACV